MPLATSFGPESVTPGVTHSAIGASDEISPSPSAMTTSASHGNVRVGRIGRALPGQRAALHHDLRQPRFVGAFRIGRREGGEKLVGRQLEARRGHADIGRDAARSGGYRRRRSSACRGRRSRRP